MACRGPARPGRPRAAPVTCFPPWQSGRRPGVLEFGECLRVHGEPRTGLDFRQETPGDLPGGEPGLPCLPCHLSPEAALAGLRGPPGTRLLCVPWLLAGRSSVPPGLSRAGRAFRGRWVLISAVRAWGGSRGPVSPPRVSAFPVGPPMPGSYVPDGTWPGPGGNDLPQAAQGNKVMAAPRLFPRDPPAGHRSGDGRQCVRGTLDPGSSYYGQVIPGGLWLPGA